jgi:hypothetical protein
MLSKYFKMEKWLSSRQVLCGLPPKGTSHFTFAVMAAGCSSHFPEVEG